MVVNVPDCVEDGCDRAQVYKTLGLCKRHYERRRNSGDPAIQKRPRPDEKAHCPGCRKRTRKNRRCRECWRADVAEKARNREPRSVDPCSIDDCTDPQEAKGLCSKHYTRFQRHGDPHLTLRPRLESPAACTACGGKAKVPGTRCRECWRDDVRNDTGCSVDGCADPHHAGGYCNKHSKRLARHGDPDAARLRSIELVKQLPRAEGECIEWPYRTKSGYGRAVVNGKAYMAHRYVWEQQKGRLSSSLELDHLCLNRACVNVNHLEPVTGAENKRRRWIRWWARQEAA